MFLFLFFFPVRETERVGVSLFRVAFPRGGGCGVCKSVLTTLLKITTLLKTGAEGGGEGERFEKGRMFEKMADAALCCPEVGS